MLILDDFKYLMCSLMPREKKQIRVELTPWRSIVVGAFLECCLGLQMSMYFGPAWPFLEQIDKTATENFFGYIIAAYSLSQILTGPIIGHWSQTLHSIIMPAQACLSLTLISNLLYIAIPAFPGHWKYVMLVARVLAGCGECVMSMTRTYSATASLPKDRQRVFGICSTGYGIGFISGPVVQLMFDYLEYPGIELFMGIRLNMYTAGPALCAVMTVLSMFMLAFVFEERYAGLANMRRNSEITVKVPKFDKVAVFLCYLTRFCQLFAFSNAEALGATFLMIMFSKTNAEAVGYLAKVYAVQGVLILMTYLMFVFVKMEKFIEFRKLAMICLGGFLLYPLMTFPWPFLSGHLQTYTAADVLAFKAGNLTQEPVGCPKQRFSWCDSTPPINETLFAVAFIISLGCFIHALTVTLSTLFSKVLGPRRQPRQQSYLQASGSLGRMLGPIVMSNLYTIYGPKIAWTFELAVLGLALLLWVAFYKRMVPLQIPEELDVHKQKKPIENAA
ncbi:unnamed protein product [Bursaphelenchus xylophilus]|uniref:(pine wood nematode) hypothetical protein n=1 Tax=Bursaphelenchus xylophilus TaxID=6326 RepID=A0A1I7RJC5_BURXY|nr:unnamed protein product [Bursaphelenchus xylophilus]CAG9128788.1 unnamed protein product [Bursaphelenchus xylophilus]